MPKVFNKKVIKKSGKNVDVDTVVLPNDVPSVKVMAVVGGTKVELSHTFGPVDGALAEAAPDHVQKSLDDIRARAAQMAVHREILSNQLDAAD